MRLGRANVDQLGRSLTAKQFREWEMYAGLEPFDETREDYRIASIVAMLYNINRSEKAQPMTLEQARVKFGEQEPPPPSWPMQIMIAKAMVAAQNAAVESGQKIVDE